MGGGPIVGIAICWRVSDFAECDHSGRTTVDAQRASGADVVIDQKDRRVRRIVAGLIDVDPQLRRDVLEIKAMLYEPAH